MMAITIKQNLHVTILLHVKQVPTQYKSNYFSKEINSVIFMMWDFWMKVVFLEEDRAWNVFQWSWYTHYRFKDTRWRRRDQGALKHYLLKKIFKVGLTPSNFILNLIVISLLRMPAQREEVLLVYNYYELIRNEYFCRYECFCCDRVV